MGQKLDEIVISGQPSTVYNFDLTPYPSGPYVVRAVFEDRVLTKKIIRVQ